MELNSLVFRASALLLLAVPCSAAAQSPPPAVNDVCFVAEGNASFGFGGTISSIEASTVQVLEVMGRERLSASIVCPEGFQRVGSVCQPARVLAAPAAGGSQPEPASRRQQSAKEARKAQSRSESLASSEPAFDSHPRQTPNVWIEAFADYEDNDHAGATQRTIGSSFGVDTRGRLGEAEFRLGLIGGYWEARQKSTTSGTTNGPAVYGVTVTDPPSPNPGDPVVVTDFLVQIPSVPRSLQSELRRSIRAVNGGVSASYNLGRFFVDAVARIEHSDISQRGSITDLQGNLTGGIPFIFNDVAGRNVYGLDGNQISGRAGGTRGCIDVRDSNDSDFVNTYQSTLTPAQRGAANQAYLDSLVAGASYSARSTPLNGETSSLSFILANSFGVAYNLGDGFILEPTTSFRYIYTDYGGGATALGIDDGTALRLEAGARLSHINVGGNGSVWINSVGLYAYSDVLVRGFVISSTGGSFASDEGEVRGRAVLQSEFQTADGFSIFGEVSGRFGDQYWGVGGKLGVRVEW